MGMFDDVAAEHERMKNTPVPSYAESCRAEWDTLGAAELAEQYAAFCCRERIPTVHIDAGQESGPGWVVSIIRDGYTMQYVGVLRDGGLLPVSRVMTRYGVEWTPADGFVFKDWERPTDAGQFDSLEDDFRRAAAVALQARDSEATG